MKIDIVYTWVNGADPIWNEKRMEKAELLGQIVPNGNSNARFMDNNELKYSLRSIYQFAPWVNRIFIVTDNQIPGWLDISHPKIKIVDHKEIFDDNSGLPNFSSPAIETKLHHIKELSEFFIYFNDDMFLGKLSTPHHFFTKQGLPNIFVSEVFPIRNKKFFDITLRTKSNRNDYQYAMVNTRQLLRDRFNKSVYYNIRHGVKPLVKSVLYELEELFHKELNRTSQNNFRTNDDVLMIYLSGFYSLIKGIGKTRYMKSVNSNNKLSEIFSFFNQKYTLGFINLDDSKIDSYLNKIKSSKPLVICLNQTPKTSNQNLEKMKYFLNDYFSQKSPFELNT